jgi:hypothetical protein
MIQRKNGQNPPYMNAGRNFLDDNFMLFSSAHSGNAIPIMQFTFPLTSEFERRAKTASGCKERQLRASIAATRVT